MLDHLGLQASDMPATAAFYDTVLAPLGFKRVMDVEAVCHRPED